MSTTGSMLVVLFLALVSFDEVSSLYKNDYNSVPLYDDKEHSSVLLDVKQISNEINELREEVQKGFMELKKELKLEKYRRHAIEEKLDTCIARGVTNEDVMVEETTTMSSVDKSTTEVTSSPTVLVVEECPENYHSFMDRCYKVVMKGAKWKNAKKLCEDEGAQLVSINTQVEQEYLESLIRKDYDTYSGSDSYWVGMTFTEGKLKWLDGSDVNYTHWNEKEPNCMQRKCNAFISEFLNYNWEDAANIYKYHYICELELAS